LARACRGPPSPPSRASPCISAHHGGGGLYPYHPPYQGEYHGGAPHHIWARVVRRVPVEEGGTQRHSEALRGTPRHSADIRGNQRLPKSLRASQSHSEPIEGTQSHSEAIGGCLRVPRRVEAAEQR
jgi:hypothetical protein